MTFEDFYTEFLERMSRAGKAKNTAELTKLMRLSEPDWKADEQELYADYCQNKAGLFALFGENTGLDDWMQKALQFSKSDRFTHIYFKWLLLYWHQLKALHDQSMMQANFSAIYNIAGQAIKNEKDYHNKMAFESNRVLILAILGKHGEAKAKMLSLNFRAISPQALNNKNKLVYFFANIYKMLIAALEIRSKACLFKILKMVTIDDFLLSAPQPIFRKFNQVVMDLSDIRPEFAANFNYMYEMRKKWSGFLPNYSIFSMMVEEENTKGLELFFGVLKN
jgi:hypothetical protein